MIKYFLCIQVLILHPNGISQQNKPSPAPKDSMVINAKVDTTYYIAVEEMLK
jgi:hypothetical protein